MAATFSLVQMPNIESTCDGLLTISSLD